MICNDVLVTTIEGSMTAFRCTELYRWMYPEINCAAVPGPLDSSKYYITGDADFVCTNRIVTPYVQFTRDGDTIFARRYFSEELSGLRGHIE